MTTPQLDPIIANLLAGAPPEPDYAILTAAEARAGLKSRIGPLLAMAPQPARRDDISIPGPGGALPLRIIRPAGPGPHPVLLFIHGGGWVICDNDTHQPMAVAFANAADVAVVMVDYRLAPEHAFPAAVDDCLAALAWVRAEGAAHGLDGSRMVVAGDSAGGNLAAVVAAHARDIAGQLLIYPVTDHVDAARHPSYVENGEGLGLSGAGMHWYWQQYGGDGPDARPLQRNDLAGLPPALVQTAQWDVLRDEGEAYAHAMQAAGVAVELIRYPSGNHGFYAFIGLVADADRAVADAARWLRSRLG
ncbi:MAG: alpha/beta hydrolase [Sphingomonadales bacterium]|jgi:acetyl esterase